MLKAAKIMAATAAAWAITMYFEIAAMAGEAGEVAAPSCGGFGGGGGGGGGDAAAAGAEGGGGLMGLMFPLALFALIFYFFIIRPQKKRQKQQDNLISSIAKGDQVVTIGGFFGTVQEVRDDSFVIELAKDVRVKILKSAVSTKRVAQAPAQGQTPAQAQIEDK
ncbi:MAG: preprotein translocase subunit YajC [Synergistaceae bacterium]|nr:preprotein translocase subunit YajC [Synergistaceae bacterium]